MEVSKPGEHQTYKRTKGTAVNEAGHSNVQTKTQTLNSA